MSGRRKNQRRRERIAISRQSGSCNSAPETRCGFDGNKPVFEIVRDSTGEANGRSPQKSSQNIRHNTMMWLWAHRKQTGLTDTQYAASERLLEIWRAQFPPGKSAFFDGGSRGTGYHDLSPRSESASRKMVQIVNVCGPDWPIVKSIVIDSVSVKNLSLVLKIDSRKTNHLLRNALSRLAVFFGYSQVVEIIK